MNIKLMEELENPPSNVKKKAHNMLFLMLDPSFKVGGGGGQVV
jgi:hypothetical protein